MTSKSEQLERKLRQLVEDAGFVLAVSLDHPGSFRITTQDLGYVGFATVGAASFTAVIPGKTYTHNGTELVDALETIKKEQGS